MEEENVSWFDQELEENSNMSQRVIKNILNLED